MKRRLILACLFGATGLAALDYLPSTAGAVVWAVCLAGLLVTLARIVWEPARA